VKDFDYHVVHSRYTATFTGEIGMKLGFIGVGNMGAAILEGIIERGAIHARDVVFYDSYAPAVERAKKTGAEAQGSDLAVVEAADMVILAVKPKDSRETLRQIAPKLAGKALLSIVAGLNYSAIYETLGCADGKTRALVILPNTPIRVGEGATGFTLETTFTAEEKAFAQKLFEAVGIVEWVPENLLCAVSALSGCGPAYASMFAEALADGGVLEGLPRAAACRLAAQTIKGTGKLILETGEHPGAIKDAVCSPGGTTIEGVRELERGAFRFSVINAVRKGGQKFFKLIK
jgi:pyrroline-5-carboxylate reductase